MNKFFLKTDPFALKVLKILLVACLATPLLAWSGVIFPYTVPKVFAFRVLVELAAIAYLFLALKYPKHFLPAFFFCHSGRSESVEPESRIKKSGCRIKSGMTIGAVILFFLIISFLSAIFGVDFYSSWWGSLERGLGIFGWLHFVVWFFMLIGVFSAERKQDALAPAGLADWLIKTSLGASTIISLLAIGQYFFSLGNLLPQVNRVYSLVGNAGILGSYLLFNIFFAGYLFFISQRKTKWVFAVGGLLSAMALLLSGTRGAWLGFLGGAVIFLVGRVWQSPQKKWRQRAVWGLLAVLVLAGGLWSVRQSAWIQKNPILSRLTSISLADKTAQNRLILWRASWQAWQERPLLGWGSDNFEVAANRYFDPRLSPYESWYDRAHNFIFDYGVADGWLGLLAYLGILVVAGWRLIKIFKVNPNFSVAFISLLAAYLIQNFFIFDSFVSCLMLFFTLALIGAPLEITPIKPLQVMNFWKKAGWVVLAVGGLAVIYNFNLKPLLAARYANRLLSLPAVQASQTTELFKDALALDSFASVEISYQVVLDYIAKIGQRPELAKDEEFYQVAAGALKKNIARQPEQSKNYVALAWLDLYFSGQDKLRLAESLELAQKVRELSPNKKESYSLLVAGYVLSGQPQKAQQAVDLARAIDAKIGEEVKAYLERLK